MPNLKVNNKSAAGTVGRLKVYTWVLSYLRPHKWTLCLFVLSGMFVSAVTLSMPKFIQYFLDVVVPNKDAGLFVLLLAAVAILLAAEVVMTGVRNRLRRVLQEKPSMDILRSLFQHLRKLGFSYYERRPAGETLSLFRDEVDNLQSLYREYVPGILQQGTMLLLSATLLVHTSPLLSSIVVPCFLVYYLIGPYFEKKAAQWGREWQIRRTETNRKLFDSVSALLEFRAYGAQGWDGQRLADKVKRMHVAHNNQHWNSYSRGNIRNVTTGLGAFAAFAVGAGLIREGSLSIGEFAAFSILYFQVMSNMTSLVTLTTEQKLILVQAERLYRFIKETPDVAETDDPVQHPTVKGRITFNRVQFRYPEQPPLIRRFELDIVAGSKVALVGRSGCGKSTLVKLLGRFYDPNEGDIRLDGVPLHQLPLSQLRETFGFVFQETFLFGLSVKENIRFGNPEASDEQIVEAAKAAYAHSFITELPQGYDTPVGERGIKLSGGQKQRIAIARMFVKDPAVIILDEATSALDNVSEHEVGKALDELMKGRTTITVAHRLSTVRHYDRIVVVDNGRRAESGSYDELVERQGLFYAMLMGEQDESGEPNQEKKVMRA